MSVTSTQARFFGLDLSFLKRDLFTAWQKMLSWPVIAWLWPRLPVRLWLSGGSAVVSHGPGTSHVTDPKRVLAARFEAVQLPEDLLLRSALQLPYLQPHELEAAVHLQMVGLSPFATSDTVWAYEAVSGVAGFLSVHLVIASRQLIAQYIGQTHPALNRDRLEVWAAGSVGSVELVLPGFGETVRARHGVVWRWVSAFLLMLVLALGMAVAVTPSVQLYLRTQQAHAAMAKLQQKAAPVVQQRETLVRTADRLNNLAEIVGRPLPPLQVLKLITDALPDDTSLLSLQVQGAKVNMSGQTANAAVLMKQLGATPGLRDVTAPTPAIKPLGATREQFTIEFTIDAARIMANK